MISYSNRNRHNHLLVLFLFVISIVIGDVTITTTTSSSKFVVEAARTCVAIPDHGASQAGGGGGDEPEHQCTDDPLLYFPQQQLGLRQRIDGTESEKAAIMDVLVKMDDYFINEVLAHPEYASVRTRCQNLNELCAFWVAVGECESNRIFMLSNCAAACRFCLLLNTDIR